MMRPAILPNSMRSQQFLHQMRASHLEDTVGLPADAAAVATLL